MYPSHGQPRLTAQEVDGLRRACAVVDQIGRLIGTTRLQSGELMLANLAEVFTAMNTIIEHYDRRMLAWRKKHHKLTPEDRALLAALENPPAEEPPATEEG